MRAGRLRRVIRLQRGVDTVNAAGTPAFAWSDHMTLRAEVVRQSSEEFLGNDGARDEAAVIFRTRFASDVRTNDRVVFEGQAWNLREVTEIGMRRGMELRCTRRQEEADEVIVNPPIGPAFSSAFSDAFF